MLDSRVADKLRHLQAAELFRGVPVAVLEDLAGQSRYKTCQAEQTLFEMDDDGDAMYLILSGALLVEQPFETGKPGFAVRRGPGEAVGEMALLDSEARMATVRALEITRVLVIHRSDFLDALRRSPDFGAALLANLARRLRAAWQQIRILQTENLQFRIVQKLVEIAGQQQRERHADPLCIRLKQAELAEMTGANPQHLAKQIAPLKALGLLEIHRGKITLLDLDALRERLQ